MYHCMFLSVSERATGNNIKCINTHINKIDGGSRLTKNSSNLLHNNIFTVCRTNHQKKETTVFAVLLLFPLIRWRQTWILLCILHTHSHKSKYYVFLWLSAAVAPLSTIFFLIHIFSTHLHTSQLYYYVIMNSLRKCLDLIWEKKRTRTKMQYYAIQKKKSYDKYVSSWNCFH